MAYIDGFLIPVRSDQKEAYRAVAATMSAMFKEHGATRVVECWADDVPDGALTSFPIAVQREPGETVVFSWIEWPSKAARDAGNEKVMSDPRMEMPSDAIMNAKRMIFGGFEVILDA